MDYYRGDIFYIKKWANVTGNEQEAGRPAVIVSSNQGNQTSGNVTVVYLTTQDKKPLMTHADVMGKVKSIALCETVSTVSKDRLAKYVRTCTDREMKRIDEALSIALGPGSVPAVDQNATVANFNEIEKLTEEKENAQKKLSDAEAELEWMRSQMHTTGTNDESVIKLTTERNLYKSLYE